MSKPLELAVFEKEPGRYGGEPRYHSPDGFWACPESHVDGYAADKRFTDAELAAEVHAANADAWRAHSARSTVMPVLEDRFVTLARFAKLPHYDEAQP